MIASAQTHTPDTPSKQTNVNVVVLAVLAILLAAVFAAVAVSSHAVERHGMLSYHAAQCYERPEIKMYNPTTGRTAFVCLTERGWGVYIVNRLGENVTSFVKEKAKRLEQVIKYLQNAGYEFVQ